MPDPPPAAPARRVLDHLPAILVAAGIVLSSSTGLAYEYFYGRLGVRPSELGLGTEEILLHGALGVGFVTVVVGLPLAVLVVVALNVVFAGDSQTDDLTLLDYVLAFGLLGTGLATVAAAVAGAPGMIAIGFLAALSAIALVRWLGRIQAQASAEAWRAAWDIGAVWYGCLVTFVGGASLAAWAIETGEDTGLVLAGGVIALVLSLIGLELGRRWAALARIDRSAEPDAREIVRVRADLVAGVVALAWLSGYLALSAVEDADRVADDGRAPQRFAGSLYSAPVRCTAIRWIDGPAPGGLPPQALYLGQSSGTVVLYEPGSGPLRLPAAAAVLAPAAARDCAAP